MCSRRSCRPPPKSSAPGQLRDFSPILEESGGVGDIIDEALYENFVTQGYGAWAPSWRNRQCGTFPKGYGPNIPLFRTGDAFAALTDRDSPTHKFLVSKSGIVVGAYTDRLRYIEALADGNPATHLPARILVQVTPEYIEKIIALLAEWLGGGDAVTIFADAPIEV